MNLRTIAASAALVLAASPLLGASSVPGLRSSGTLVVQANVQGQPLDIGGNVALYHKNDLYRLDVLSLGFPGTDKGLSALASTLIGPGGVTVLYDAATGAMTAWSTANRTYFPMAAPRAQTAGAPATPSASATASAGGDPLAALATIGKALANVQTATIQLTGHRTVNGHPTTDVDVQMKRQLPGKPLEDYHAQVALADDLGDFPVQIAFESTPATKDAMGGKFKLDLTSIQRDTPDDSVFVVPQGYTRASSLSGVLGRGSPLGGH